ncbi:hypothetical protein ZWY2020_028479 [Hordeum vulgare]|nr:hypothetical protein ZWY2020_028479 [Hordeum vulgare]
MGRGEREAEGAYVAREEALREAKEAAKCRDELAAREEELSLEAIRLDAKQPRFEEWEVAASRKVLLDAHEGTLPTAEEKKAAELGRFPTVELELSATLRSLYRDGFDEPLASPEDSLVALAKGLVVALESTVVQVDKVLDSDYHDLFFAGATRVFSQIHLSTPPRR